MDFATALIVLLAWYSRGTFLFYFLQTNLLSADNESFVAVMVNSAWTDVALGMLYLQAMLINIQVRDRTKPRPQLYIHQAQLQALSITSFQ